MKMAHLSQTPPNMSSIGAVCVSLGKTFLTSLVGNYWATDGLRVNSSPVKGEFIIFPLFLLEENAILPMTARADCDSLKATVENPRGSVEKLSLKESVEGADTVLRGTLARYPV